MLLITNSFFFNDTATTEIYTLSYTTLFRSHRRGMLRHVRGRLAPAPARDRRLRRRRRAGLGVGQREPGAPRSEEHTSELQSRQYLVCRLLLEKKKKC